MRGSREGETGGQKNGGGGVRGGRKNDQWQHRGERCIFARKKWAAIAHIPKIIE